MPQDHVEIIVAPDGTVRHLVDPVSERLATAIGPKVQTKRASHVESWHDLTDAAKNWLLANAGEKLNHVGLPADTNAFWADMLPSGGPVLGPFDAYAQAIEAEIKWLHENNMPV